MQDSVGSNSRTEALPGAAVNASATLSLLKSQPEVSPNFNPVYDLRSGSHDSSSFYADATKFADEVLARIDEIAGDALDGYCKYLRMVGVEKPRSRGEYAVELLTLGMALRTYAAAAQSTPGWVMMLAQSLLWVRRRIPILKRPADSLRSVITRYFFLPSIEVGRRIESDALNGAHQQLRTDLAPARLTRLIRWLRATGEFEQEALRLRFWQIYLATLAPETAQRSLAAAVELYDEFARNAQSRLGAYTEGVEKFLSNEYAHRGVREDQIFCGRQRAEYHLNMIAAEVMNRGLREAFERTARKAVLVPACMRGSKASTCKAHSNGVDLTCRACDPDCAVNRITRRMRKLGAQVYIVPHTTGFSRWLDRWEREPGVGVTAVACMLNILPGGYEMRARRIASQCVPLDYPGCQNHWDRNGSLTGVNEDRLVGIVAGADRIGGARI
jgi:hypothetical protein